MRKKLKKETSCKEWQVDFAARHDSCRISHHHRIVSCFQQSLFQDSMMRVRWGKFRLIFRPMEGRVKIPLVVYTSADLGDLMHSLLGLSCLLSLSSQVCEESSLSRVRTLGVIGRVHVVPHSSWNPKCQLNPEQCLATQPVYPLAPQAGDVRFGVRSSKTATWVKQAEKISFVIAWPWCIAARLSMRK